MNISLSLFGAKEQQQKIYFRNDEVQQLVTWPKKKEQK